MELNFAGLYTKFYKLTDHTKCNVDTPKRLGGYVIDWIVGGILSGLPAVLLYSAITQRTDMFSDLYVFESLGYARGYALGVGVLCLAAALFYYVIVPWKIYPGQTLGKRIAGFKIVKTDDTQVTLKTLILRQVIGLFLLEGAAFIISNYVRQLTTLSLNFYVDYYWAIAGMVITLISVILVLKTDSHRALHDYLAKTKVILAETVTPEEEPEVAVKQTVIKKDVSQETATSAVRGKRRLPKKQSFK